METPDAIPAGARARLRDLDAWWRAANDLGAVQIYLSANEHAPALRGQRAHPRRTTQRRARVGNGGETAGDAERRDAERRGEKTRRDAEKDKNEESGAEVPLGAALEAWVIPVQEELLLARDTFDVVRRADGAADRSARRVAGS